MKFLDYFPNGVFQTFKDKQDSKGYAKVFLKFDKERFQKLNKLGCGIYFTPNGFNGGRKKNLLIKLNAIYADLDVAKEGENKDTYEGKIKILKALNSLELKPNFIIITKNGLQPIWLISEDKIDQATQEKYVNVINGIIEWSKKYGSAGDKVHDVTRVLRMPNFYHVKGKPFLCKTIKTHEKRFSLGDLAEQFPYREEKRVIRQSSNGFAEIDNVDFCDLVIRAFRYVGRSAEFDKQDRLILDGRLTGTFKSRQGDFLASTSHEPFQGNRVTCVADILSCTNKEAYAWIKQEYNISTKEVVKKQQAKKIIQSVKPEAKRENVFYTWGTDELTKKFAPIKRSSYIVLTGETGDGKTTFAYNMAIKNAILGRKVLYVSLEMDTIEIFENIARSYAGITIEEEVYKKIPENKQKAFNRKMEELKNIPNLKTIGMRKGADVTWEAVELLIEGEWDLIFIDNLDLIIGEPSETDFMRQRRISRKIMNYTSIKQTPIVLLHHYRKKGKSGGERTLDDIGGSAKITHDADRIVMLSRIYGEDISPEEKASLRLYLNKARGYTRAMLTIYFIKGDFHDKYKINSPLDPQWWIK